MSAFHRVLLLPNFEGPRGTPTERVVNSPGHFTRGSSLGVPASLPASSGLGRRFFSSSRPLWPLGESIGLLLLNAFGGSHSRAC